MWKKMARNELLPVLWMVNWSTCLFPEVLRARILVILVQRQASMNSCAKG